MKLLYPIILASGSPRRKELLSSILGDQYTIKVSNIDESVHTNENPTAYCLRMSLEKGQAIIDSDIIHKQQVIISADTIVVLGKKILGKPSSEEENKLFLSFLSSKTHTVYTSVSIFKPETPVYSSIEKTNVTFRYLDTDEIESYCKLKEGLDKAGGYALQGSGSSFIERIDGSYSNVIGLPISELKSNLIKLNVIR